MFNFHFRAKVSSSVIQGRFPADFMFKLTEQEWDLISSQFVMTSRLKSAQLDAISTALAELQAKPADNKIRKPIGFIQPKD